MTRTSLLYDPALLAKAIICLLLHCGEHRLAGACSPSQSKNLNDVIEEGLRSYRQDDRVTLTFPSSPPVTDGVLRRPRLGEDVRLECYIPPGRDWRNITWLHQDRTIFEAGRIAAGIPNGQQYRLALSSPTQTLTIVNVTLQASGTVRCMDTASSTQPTIITQYTLRPLVRHASEIFVPVTPQSVRVGERITLPCGVRMPLPDDLIINRYNHLIWRYKGKLLHAPTEEPYGALWPKGRPRPSIQSTGVLVQNRPGATANFPMTLDGMSAEDSGYAECWFRPHPGAHEWVVQRTAMAVVPPGT